MAILPLLPCPPLYRSHGNIMLSSICRKIKGFLRDTDGSVAVEAVVIMPFLFWSYMAMYVFFDAFLTRSATDKAAYTISDMLSRETAAIDSTYLSAAHSLFDFLAKSSTESALRVTVVSWSGVDNNYHLEWSKTNGDVAAMLDADMVELALMLPNMSSGETLIVVETFSTYESSMNVGMGEMDLSTFVFTRPRFAPQLIWSS